MNVIPEGLAAASAAVEAIAVRMAAAEAAAAPVIGAVVPPAADPVSLLTAAGFSTQGAQHGVIASQGITELSRAAAGLAQSSAAYLAADAGSAATYSGAGGS